MTAATPIVYEDDTDALIEWRVTDRDGAGLDWPILLSIDGGDYDIPGTWVGDVGATRTLTHGWPAEYRVRGVHTVRCQIDGGTDFHLGRVFVSAPA